jgi:hypothetical protein
LRLQDLTGSTGSLTQQLGRINMFMATQTGNTSNLQGQLRNGAAADRLSGSTRRRLLRGALAAVSSSVTACNSGAIRPRGAAASTMLGVEVEDILDTLTPRERRIIQLRSDSSTVTRAPWTKSDGASG